jgi:hypothetical protein
MSYKVVGCCLRLLRARDFASSVGILSLSMPDPDPLRIGNPGWFVLPDGKFPVLLMSVHRNEQGQIWQIIVHFDKSLRAKLQSSNSVLLELRGTGDQIEIDTSGQFCWDQDFSTPGIRHFEVTKLGQTQTQTIETWIQAFVRPRNQ